MIVAGTLTNKMAPALRKVYDQVTTGFTLTAIYFPISFSSKIDIMLIL